GRAGAHVDPGAAPQLDVAGRLERAVGSRDGVRVQAVSPRQRPHRRQALARCEHTAQDPQLELGHELVVKRDAALALEHEVHAGLSAELGDYGPVRSLFATSRARLVARLALYGGGGWVGRPPGLVPPPACARPPPGTR